MSKQNYEQQLESWIVKEKTAVSLSNIIGNLLFDYSTELVLFRSKLVDQSNTEILKLQLEQAESNIKVSILFPGPHTVRTKLFSAERNRPEELARDPNAPEHPISSVEDMLEMMSSMGIEMETTEPEEVASFCLAEIKKSNYWINPVNEKSEQAFKDRVESILTRSDLPNPNIF